MNKHYIESWPKANGIASAAGDIARHLQVRQSLGPAIIITKRPAILLSAVRKQWMKLQRSLQTEHSRTLDATLRRALTQEIAAMQQLRFIAKNPLEAQADIFFVDIDIATRISLPPCATLYAEDLPSDVLGRFLNSVTRGGVAVRYDVTEK